MQYTSISAYSVQGLIHNAADLVAYDDRPTGLRVTITANPNPHLHVVNRQLALASMMLQGMIPEPLDEAFPRHLQENIGRIQQQRLATVGTDGVVVIQITGDVAASIPEHCRTINDFLLCFDAVDKNALRISLIPKVSAVLTALRLGGSRNYEFRLIAECIYLTTSEGVIVHSMTLEGASVQAYQSSPLDDSQVQRIAQDIPLVLRAGNLERIVRLYTQSLNRDSDNYRSFIAAWSALEMLTGKIFPTYQKLLSEELRRANQSPGLRAYLDRVDEVMEGKHNLADKFSVISVFLADEGTTDDLMTTFRRVKKVRDGLSHGEEISEESLPTRDVQQLFEKLLKNHVRSES